MDRVLLIDDDAIISKIVKNRLEQRGYLVDHEFDGRKGLEQAKKFRYSAMLLDISLPVMDGFQILKNMSDLGIDTPTLIMSIHTDIENEIKSYKNGAKLFHKKPINLELLETQVTALIDSQSKSLQEAIKFGDLVIDLDRAYVSKDRHEIKCSPKELKLLGAIAQANGKVLSRQSLVSITAKDFDEPEEASIDTLVCRLRKKLGKYRGGEVIETVHGYGYRLNLSYLDGFREKRN